MLIHDDMKWTLSTRVSSTPGHVLITTLAHRHIVSQAWHRLPMGRNRIGDMTSQCQPAPRCLMNCVTTQGNFKKDYTESGWVQPDVWYIVSIDTEHNIPSCGSWCAANYQNIGTPSIHIECYLIWSNILGINLRNDNRLWIYSLQMSTISVRSASQLQSVFPLHNGWTQTQPARKPPKELANICRFFPPLVH